MLVVNVRGGTSGAWKRVRQVVTKDWKCPNCGNLLRYFWLSCPNCKHPRPEA